MHVNQGRQALCLLPDNKYRRTSMITYESAAEAIFALGLSLTAITVTGGALYLAVTLGEWIEKHRK